MNKKTELIRVYNRIVKSKNLIELEDAEKDFRHLAMKIELYPTSELYNKIKNTIELIKIKIKKNYNIKEQKIIRITESQLIKTIEKIIIENSKKEVTEKLGVPEGILESSEDLFNDIISKMKECSSIKKLEQGFEITGNYKVGDHIFETINVKFELLIDENNTLELYGAGTYKKSKLSSKFTLQHVELEHRLELVFRIFLSPEQTVQDVVNLFVKEPDKMISTFTHEIGHGYYDVKKGGEKSTERVDYQTFSSNKFGNVEPLNNFLFYSYYIHGIENIVRPSELAQLLRLHGVTKKNFLQFYQKTEIYENLKNIQNFTYQYLRDQLKKHISEIKEVFNNNGITYSDKTDEQIINYALELVYINLVNWKGDVMKGILTSNFMESIIGFSGDKDKFFTKYLNNINKYQDNPLDFFKSETKRFNMVSTKMIKKLSKLYDYLSNSTEKPNHL